MEINRNTIIKVAEWKGFVLPEYYYALSGIKKLNNDDIHVLTTSDEKQYWLSYAGSFAEFVVTNEDIIQYKRESKLNQISRKQRIL